MEITTLEETETSPATRSVKSLDQSQGREKNNNQITGSESSMDFFYQNWGHFRVRISLESTPRETFETWALGGAWAEGTKLDLDTVIKDLPPCIILNLLTSKADDFQ